MIYLIYLFFVLPQLLNIGLMYYLNFDDWKIQIRGIIIPFRQIKNEKSGVIT